MLEPFKLELPKLYVGVPYEVVLRLWEDEAATIPFDLENWTVTLQLSGDGPELTSGHGLAIINPEGRVTVRLTKAQELKLRRSPTVAALFIEKEGEELFPARGTFTVEPPLGV